METGLPGMGVECAKHEGRTLQEDIKVFEFEEVEINVT